MTEEKCAFQPLFIVLGLVVIVGMELFVTHPGGEWMNDHGLERHVVECQPRPGQYLMTMRTPPQHHIHIPFEIVWTTCSQFLFAIPWAWKGIQCMAACDCNLGVALVTLHGCRCNLGVVSAA